MKTNYRFVTALPLVVVLLALQGCNSRWDNFKQVQGVQGEYKQAWTNRADKYARVLAAGQPAEKPSAAALSLSKVERLYYEAALSELHAFSELRKSGVVLSSARGWLLKRRMARIKMLRSLEFSDDDLRTLIGSAETFDVKGMPADRVAAFAQEFGAIVELNRLLKDLSTYGRAYREAFRADDKNVPPARPPMSPGMMNAIISGAQAGARIGSGIK